MTGRGCGFGNAHLIIPDDHENAGAHIVRFRCSQQWYKHPCSSTKTDGGSKSSCRYASATAALLDVQLSRRAGVPVVDRLNILLTQTDSCTDAEDSGAHVIITEIGGTISVDEDGDFTFEGQVISQNQRYINC